MKKSNVEFLQLAAGQKPKALVMVRAALKRGGSAKAAADDLGIGLATIYRIGQRWPAFRKALEDGMPSPQAIGVMGGVASAVAARKRARA